MAADELNRLVARLNLLLFCFLASAALSALLPLVWHDKLFIDGLTIIRSQPRLEWFGNSYGAAAYLLHPLLRMLAALGVRLDDYGLGYTDDLVLANMVFGVMFLAGIASFALRWRLRADAGNMALFFVFVTLLSPFFFCISKELIPFAIMCAAVGLYRCGMLGVRGCALAYAAAMALCGLYFRVYYLAYAAIFLYNFALWRHRGLWIAGCLAMALLLILFHQRLPLDLLTQGRAGYLEGVSASRIEYYFDDGQALGFVANRTLTFGMLLLPLNLLLVSPAYAPFIALQILLTARLWRVWRHPCSSMQALAASAVLSFSMVAALFEPDFGSYFRHKVGILLFMLMLVVRFEWHRDKAA
ncbi:hypothetical protein [Dyella sp. 2RAB6]|uniref:hypothetical protein n=1 Tax=Dyella sp. 2RAB6 TaxID=3232992 RepID=UPI003F8E4631